MGAFVGVGSGLFGPHPPCPPLPAGEGGTRIKKLQIGSPLPLGEGLGVRAERCFRSNVGAFHNNAGTFHNNTSAFRANAGAFHNSAGRSTTIQVRSAPTQVCSTTMQVCCSPTQVRSTTMQVCCSPTQGCCSPTQVCFLLKGQDGLLSTG